MPSSLFHRLKKALLAIGILVLLLAVGVYIASRTDSVRGYLLHKGQQYLARQGIELSASKLELDLARLSLTLTDLELRSLRTPGLPPFLSATRAHVDAALLRSITGVPSIEEALFENVRIHLLVDEEGETNLPGGAETTEPEPPPQEPSDLPRFLVRSARVERGSFVLEDRSHQAQAEVPLFHLTLEGDPVSLVHELALDAGAPGAVTWREESLPLERLLLQARVSSQTLDVRSLELALGESRILADGSLGNPTSPRLDMEVQARLVLGELAGLVRPGGAVGGQAEAALSIEGPLDALRVSADATGNDLVYQDFPPADLSLQASWDESDQIVEVSSLFLSSPAGEVDARGNLRLAPDSGESSLQAVLRNLDLAVLSEPAQPSTRVACVANGSIDAAWPDLDFTRAEGTAHLALAPTRSETAVGLVPISGSLRANARAGRLQVDISRLEALGARLGGTVGLSTDATDADYLNGALDGRLEVRASRLAVVLLEAAKLRGETAPESVDGSAVIAIGIAGTPQSPRLALNLAANELRLGELADLHATAEAAYAGNKLSVANLEVSDPAYPERPLLSARGEMGLEGESAPLSFEIEARDLPVAPLLVTATGSAPADGTLFLEGNVSGSRKAPVGDLDLRVENLKAYGEDLGLLTGSAALAERVDFELLLEKPVLDGDPGSIEANGSFLPETRAYELQVESEGLRFDQLEVPGAGAVQGTVELSASGSGTIDDPSLEVNLESPDLLVNGRELGPLSASSRVLDRAARVELELSRMALSAWSEVGLDAPRPLSFELSLRDTDLSQLPIENEELSGRVTATASGMGNLDDPKASTVDLEVRDLELSYRDQLVRSEDAIRARYQDRFVSIDSASLLAGSSRVELKGNFPIEPEAGTGEVALEGDLLLADLARFVPPEEGLSLDGRLRIEGSIAGNLEQLDPRLSVRMEQGSVAHPSVTEPVSGIDFGIDLEGGVLRWTDLNAEMGPARVSSEGEVPLSVFGRELPLGIQSEAAPMRASLRLQNFQLSLLDAVPEKVQGVVSLDLEAQSPAADLEQVEATLTFDDLTIESGGYRMEQTAPTALAVRDGSLRIQQFELEGEETRIEVEGEAGLTGARALDLRASGSTDLAAIAAAMEDVQMAGASRFELSAGGTLDSPDLAGSLNLEEVELAIHEPEIAATGLSAEVLFRDDRLTIEELSGEVNGGRLNVSGGARLGGGEVADVDVAVRAEEVYLEYPLDLQTLTSLDLRLSSQDGGIVIGGDVAIQRGAYTERLEIEDEVLERLRSGGDPEIPQERNDLLARIRYDLGLRTVDPVVLDNNLGETALTFDLHLGGGFYRPGLTGRLDLEEGGEIRLRENTYIIERGTVSFLNDTRIEPALDLLARTDVRDYEVTLQVTGAAGDIDTTLTSDPYLPQVDLLALLATGRTLEEFRGEEVHVAEEQLLSYLAGRASARFTPELEQALGLSEVRIEPHLVAAESDPTARLTVGQEIAPDLRLVYSQNLTDSADQIYIAEYEPTRRFATHLTQQEDNSYRFDFRHRKEFGGSPSTGRPVDKPRGPRPRIESVSLLGSAALPEGTLVKELDLEAGDEFDLFAVRKAIERVEEAYRERGYLEVRTHLGVPEGEEAVQLTIEVSEGPRVFFRFEGDPVPGKIQKAVRQLWSDGFFDRQRSMEAVEAIRGDRMKEGYLEARVESSIEPPAPDSDEKTVSFRVDAGLRYRKLELWLDGGKGVEPSRIDELLKELDARETIETDPDRIVKALTTFYASEGFLDAEVKKPRYELDRESRSARVVIEIREGDLYRVGSVSLAGNRAVAEQELQEAIPLEPGLPYRVEDRRAAITAIEKAYWDLGYNDVVVTPRTEREESERQVQVGFEIQEGRKEVVDRVTVEGTENTTEAFVLSQLEVAPGSALDLDWLSASRRNLYHTGAFATVEMERLPEEADDGEKPVNLLVRVREVEPYSLRYGASFDTEKGPGAVVDLMNRNSLGRARTAGVRVRYDGWLREVRLYLSQPQLRNFPLKSNATLFYSKEFLSRDEGEELLATTAGLSIDQELKLKNLYVFSAGYRYEWNEVAALLNNPDLEGIVPPHVTAPLTATLTRDTRDEILDATRGSFQSQAIEIAPEFLGSDMGYLRYFGQYNKYIPFSDPSRIPWVGLFKSRWVYAGSVRVGLSGGLGSPEVPIARRFFTGGGTSVRGFEHNSIGPFTGGNAVFVMNQELRFPLLSFFDGVGFVDVGNVYETVGDFDLGDLRETAGVGLRVRTPYLLIRLDYGFKLDRRPGESSSSLFFSIGQAF
jgi:outer membrane protein assembly complex protein YaeT